MDINKIKSMSINEYVNTINYRDSIVDNYCDNYKKLAEHLKNIIDVEDFKRKFKIIINALFKENFPPMKNKKGFIINGDEYALISNEIKVRKYKCKNYYTISYFDNYFGHNKPEIYSIFCENSEISAFIKEILEAFHELNKQIELKNEEMTITEKAIDTHHLHLSSWEQPCYRFKTYGLLKFVTYIIKTEHRRDQYMIRDSLSTMGAGDKDALVDDDYFEILCKHYEDVLKRINELIDHYSRITKKYNEIIVNSKYGNYLIAESI